MTETLEIAAGAEPSVPPPAVDPTQQRKLPRRAWLLAGGFGLATLITRLPGLNRPRIMVFDEVYYAIQGLEIAQTGVEQGHTVHPPLAKWLIAAGIKVFGFTPFGWRVVPLLAGVLVVMATVIAAVYLLETLWLAGFAGLIVLTDGISFTNGRLALLDGIVAAFVTLAFVFVVRAVVRPLDIGLRRRCEVGAAAALGAALASKWSAALVIALSATVFAVLAWRASTAGPMRRRALVRTALVTLGIPVAMYAVTYLPTVVKFDQSAIGRELCSNHGDCDPSITARLAAIYRDHRAVWRFHDTLVPRNRYAHNATSWFLQTEPVGFLKTECPSADPVCSPTDQPSVRRIIGIGNPIIWGFGTLALFYVALSSIWRWRFRLIIVPLWASVLWLVPWIVQPELRLGWPLRVARPGYTFYAGPVVPVLAIALAATIAELRGRWRPAIAATMAAAAIVGAMALYPAWTARPTSSSYLAGLVDR
jgi:dolichyl-phosphate-mannose--protein O-mannosyl transferase